MLRTIQGDIQTVLDRDRPQPATWPGWKTFRRLRRWNADGDCAYAIYVRVQILQSALSRTELSSARR